MPCNVQLAYKPQNAKDKVIQFDKNACVYKLIVIIMIKYIGIGVTK